MKLLMLTTTIVLTLATPTIAAPRFAPCTTAKVVCTGTITASKPGESVRVRDLEGHAHSLSLPAGHPIVDVIGWQLGPTFRRTHAKIRFAAQDKKLHEGWVKVENIRVNRTAR